MSTTKEIKLTKEETRALSNGETIYIEDGRSGIELKGVNINKNKKISIPFSEED